MFIKGREERDWENSAWFVDGEGNVGNWWKISNEQIRMIKAKGWVTNTEKETIRRKIENEGRMKLMMVQGKKVTI